MEPVSSVLLNIMCNSDFRIHCLQPGDLQQHGEWSQACAEESWELHPATSFLWPGGREPGVSCAAPGRWTAATIKLVIWRQLVRYWHCFLSSWAVNYGTSQNFSARRWPLLVPNTSALLSLSSIIKLPISCQLLTLQTSTHRIQKTVKHSVFIDP